MRRIGFTPWAIIAVLLFGLVWSVQFVRGAGAPSPATDYRLRLAAGERAVYTAETGQFFADSKRSPYFERGGVIQFTHIPDSSTRARLASLGVQLNEYVPDMAFLATIPSSLNESDLAGAGIRWVGKLRPEEKVSEILQTGGPLDWTRDSTGLARFAVKVYRHISPDEAASWLAGEYGAVILGESQLANAVDVGLPAQNWSDIAADERVVWVEPFWPRREHNNSNRVNCGAEVTQAVPYSLTGSGVVVGEWDSGRADSAHADFGGRVRSGDNSPVQTHSTHVAGTVLGSGAQSSGTYRGMAPQASLVSYQWWGSSSELEGDYQKALDTFNIEISQNSWGVGFGPPTTENCNAFLGNYFLECGTLDNVIRGGLGKSVSISWSAGNERGSSSSYCGSIGYTWGTVTPYGTAKNVITVGAINSNNSTMTSFSSWGPTDDGRIKPDLVAPGCQTDGDGGVTSTKPGSGYTIFCGTSMAAPTVTGCLALWLQQYHTLYPAQRALASTVKAAFIQTADDLGDPGPEYDFGWGRINVVKAVDLLNAGTFLEEEIASADTFSWTFTSDGSIPNATFTLAWDDVGAAENASPTLVNDLDLRLQGPGEIPVNYSPWHLDPFNPSANATTGADHTNNVEQVQRTVPLTAGIWRVKVIGYNVPSGPQKFSLAYSAGIVLTPDQAQYAAQLIAGPDQSYIPGHHPVTATIRNLGRRDDRYDLSFTSARGWTITPNPSTPLVVGLKDSTLTFDLSIPLAVSPGELDTVVASMVSQGNPLVTGTDTLFVSVQSGYSVLLNAHYDTAGVPSRVISVNAKITNQGTFTDLIGWSTADQAGWTISPAYGSVTLMAGHDTTFALSVSIPFGASVGLNNRLLISGVSQGNPLVTDQDTTYIRVIDFPPTPVLKTFINGVLSNSTTPLLVWSHMPYAPFPPGFGVFLHTVETADDSAMTFGLVRHTAIADTQLVVSGLLDGVHYWRAITDNAIGDSSGYSASGRFELDTQPPDPPYLISPPDGAANSDSTPTFVWGAINQAKTPDALLAEYRLQVSFDSLFSTIWNDSLVTGTTTYTLPIWRYLNTCSTHVFWRVSARDPAGNLSTAAGPNRYNIFRRGDVNFDCTIDVLDVTAIIDFVFSGQFPPLSSEQGEVNCTSGADVLDVVYLIDYVFSGGPAPCGPE